MVAPLAAPNAFSACLAVLAAGAGLGLRAGPEPLAAALAGALVDASGCEPSTDIARASSSSSSFVNTFCRKMQRESVVVWLFVQEQEWAICGGLCDSHLCAGFVFSCASVRCQCGLMNGLSCNRMTSQDDAGLLGQFSFVVKYCLVVLSCGT